VYSRYNDGCTALHSVLKHEIFWPTIVSRFHAICMNTCYRKWWALHRQETVHVGA
jgi:hypothetical protein